MPVIALTATATSQVQKDIIQSLSIPGATVFRSSFNRPNIRYEIRFSELLDDPYKDMKHAIEMLANLVQSDEKNLLSQTKPVSAQILSSPKPSVQLQTTLLSNHSLKQVAPGINSTTSSLSIAPPPAKRAALSNPAAFLCGIIYCHKRETCEEIANRLQKDGFSVQPYHAGLSDSIRTKILTDWTEDRISIVVATVAFGMGINKPNVRFVFHYDIPKNIESFYQESGRAGRDGKPSLSIVYYDAESSRLAVFLINKNATDEKIRENSLSALQQFVSYCTKPACRRQTILKYFGETFKPANPTGGCRSCDFCLDKTAVLKQLENLQRSTIRRENPGLFANTTSATGSNAPQTTPTPPQAVGFRSARQAAKQPDLYDMKFGVDDIDDEVAYESKLEKEKEDRRYKDITSKGSKSQQLKIISKLEEEEEEEEKKQKSLGSLLSLGGFQTASSFRNNQSTLKRKQSD